MESGRPRRIVSRVARRHQNARSNRSFVLSEPGCRFEAIAVALKMVATNCRSSRLTPSSEATVLTTTPRITAPRCRPARAA